MIQDNFKIGFLDVFKSLDLNGPFRRIPSIFAVNWELGDSKISLPSHVSFMKLPTSLAQPVWLSNQTLLGIRRIQILLIFYALYHSIIEEDKRYVIEERLRFSPLILLM
jgi:hypothetical protein